MLITQYFGSYLCDSSKILCHIIWSYKSVFGYKVRGISKMIRFKLLLHFSIF